MFQGWHAPFCQIALNCWEISSSVVNLLIGLLETDVPRHGCTKGNYDPKLWRTLLPGGGGTLPTSTWSWTTHFTSWLLQRGTKTSYETHCLCGEPKNNTLRRSRIISLWWPTQKQIKNCRKIKPSVFFTAMPFSFALSLTFFCRHDYDGASGYSSWHLCNIAVYNLTSYISFTCLCV